MVVWVVAFAEHLLVRGIIPFRVMEAVGGIKMGFSENGHSHGRANSWASVVQTGNQLQELLKRDYSGFVQVAVKKA
jgi:hypothetical protein